MNDELHDVKKLLISVICSLHIIFHIIILLTNLKNYMYS